MSRYSVEVMNFDTAKTETVEVQADWDQSPKQEALRLFPNKAWDVIAVNPII